MLQITVVFAVQKLAQFYESCVNNMQICTGFHLFKNLTVHINRVLYTWIKDTKEGWKQCNATGSGCSKDG